MKHFLRLYKNELGRNRIFALLMLFAHYRLFVYFMEVVGFANSRIVMKLNDLFIWFLFFVILGVLPLILYYSFVPGQTFNMKHLLFSLPVQRSMYIIARYCALVSMVLYVVLGYFLLDLLPLHFNSGLTGFLLPRPHLLFTDYFYRVGYIGILHFLAPIALLAGLVCAAESLHHVIKHYTSVARFIFFMGSLLGVLWSMKYLASHLFVLPYFSARGIEVIQEIMILYYPTVSAYAVVIGLVFLLLGIFVYERFADV